MNNNVMSGNYGNQGRFYTETQNVPFHATAFNTKGNIYREGGRSVHKDREAFDHTVGRIVELFQGEVVTDFLHHHPIGDLM